MFEEDDGCYGEGIGVLAYDPGAPLPSSADHAHRQGGLCERLLFKADHNGAMPATLNSNRNMKDDRSES